MRHFAGLLATAALVSSTHAAPISSELIELLEKHPEATQRVMVVMQDAPGARAHINNLVGARFDVETALKQNAALSQEALLNDLGQMGFTSEANVNTNWLANTIFMDATPEQVRALSDRSDVKAVEFNGEVSLPPITEKRVSTLAEGDDSVSTWGLKATKALEARSKYAVDGSGVLVGILDTGYDGANPLLAGKVHSWKSFISDSQTQPIDDNGHGSHCAGTVGGSSGGGMEIGMAPGVKFVVGKILSGSGSGSWEGVLGGMQWVVNPDGQPNTGDEPALVSNSWGGGRPVEALQTAVQNWLALGVAPIFAAGNSGPRPSTMGYPGGYLESFAVGANTVQDTVASFSSRGPVKFDGVSHIKPDISAPGKDVTSVKANKPGEYWTISGTSMATPHVAGLAALMFQANPDLSVSELFEAMIATSIDMGAEGKDNDWGEGKIDAMRALELVVKGGKLMGSVANADGQAITHARVTVVERNTTVRLDSEGKFRAALPEGTYTLKFEAFGYTTAEMSGVQVSAGATTHADVVMDRAASGVLAGTLTGAGAGVQGTIQVLNTPLDVVTTDPQGHFSITLPAGTYELMGTAYGYEVGTSDGVTVVADETSNFTFDLAKLPPVLVIDDDQGRDYEAAYVAALGNTAHKLVDYDAVKAVMSADFLAQYEVVIWSHGRAWRNTFEKGDQEAVAGYLSNGGRLFTCGQGVASELRRNSFLKDSLGAKYINGRNKGLNISGALEFTLGQGDGVAQTSADTLAAEAGAEDYLFYSDEAKGTAAVRFAKGNGKSVFFGFGLEGIDTAAKRAEVMAAVMAYLAPSASELAARLDGISEEAAEAGLADALRGLVSTRIEAGEELGSVQDRELQRKALFEALN